MRFGASREWARGSFPREEKMRKMLYAACGAAWLVGGFTNVALADGDADRVIDRDAVKHFATLPNGVRFPEGITADPDSGEVYVGSTVLHGVINEIVRGFPVLPTLPCEGVGYEVGSMAIIKGTRNLDAAKRFYDWALTADAQKIGLDVKEYAIPTNRSVALPAQVPKLTDIKVIDYDFAKYGSSDTRKRLLDRWEKEVNSIAK